MSFGYQDRSIPERGEFHQEDLREEAAERELVAEAKRESGRPSGLAGLLARLRRKRPPDPSQ